MRRRLSEAVERFRSLAEGTEASTIHKQLRKLMSPIDYMAMGIKKGSLVSFKADTKVAGALDTAGPGLQMDVRGHWKGRVLIRLDPSDTYTVIFGRIRKSTWKVDKIVRGVYVDQLGKTVKHNVLGTGIRK